VRGVSVSGGITGEGEGTAELRACAMGIEGRRLGFREGA
jgi:hypothetical protein